MQALIRLQTGPGARQIARLRIAAVVRDQALRAASPLTHPEFREALTKTRVDSSDPRLRSFVFISIQGIAQI